MATPDIDAITSKWQSLGGRSAENAGVSCDARSQPEYAGLREEIAKAEGIGGDPKRVDWSRVVALASPLVERSGDLQVAAYLCLGLFQTEGYKGLAGGLSCIRGAASTARGAISPKQERRLAAAMQWLAENIERTRIQRPPQTADSECAGACLKIAGALEADFPGWGRALTEKWVPALSMPVETPHVAVDVPKQQASAPGTSVEWSGSEADVKRAWGVLSEAAGKEFASDRAAVWPYKVVRMAMWGPLQSYPENTNRKTKLARPSATVLRRFPELQRNGEWNTLLDDAESQYMVTPLWLDLQSYSYSALRGIGPAYAAAAEAVRLETSGLLTRFPDLIFYTFNDGTPLACPKTRHWFKEITERPGTPETRSGENAADDQLSAAESTMRRTGFDEAAEILGKMLQEARNGRERFRLRMIFADICTKEARMEMAMAQFRILDAEADLHRLAEWEPQLCVEYLSAWWSVLSDMRKSADVSISIDRIYTLLTRIDATSALKLVRKN